MGGHKNNKGFSSNGTRHSDDERRNSNATMQDNHNTDNHITIRINKSYLFGAGCALFGALLVIGLQKFMGTGGPHTNVPHQYSEFEQRETTGSYQQQQKRQDEKQEPVDNHVSNEYTIHTLEGRHPVSFQILQGKCIEII